jgi:uncharacterized protein YbcV (DUF1398 family)
MMSFKMVIIMKKKKKKTDINFHFSKLHMLRTNMRTYIYYVELYIIHIEETKANRVNLTLRHGNNPWSEEKLLQQIQWEVKIHFISKGKFKNVKEYITVRPRHLLRITD